MIGEISSEQVPVKEEKAPEPEKSDEYPLIPEFEEEINQDTDKEIQKLANSIKVDDEGPQPSENEREKDPKQEPKTLEDEGITGPESGPEEDDYVYLQAESKS